MRSPQYAAATAWEAAPGPAMSGEEITAQAADLAERILDEVSKLEQDWSSVARWSRELADLAETAAAGSPGEG